MKIYYDTSRSYYKYIDTENILVDLYESNNQTYIDSTTKHFVINSVTAWSTTQTYILNTPISAKEITTTSAVSWVQQNAGWTVKISATTEKDQNIILLEQNHGYGQQTTLTNTIDFTPLEKIISITIYASCYRRSEAYCYGSIDIGLKYTDRQIVQTTAQDYDFYKDVNKYFAVGNIERKYYKFTYSKWVQPTLTENGSLGGNSFAVNALNTDSRTQPYYAFDTNLADVYTAGWLSKASNNYLEWYNPDPLNITQLSIQYQTTAASSVGYISSWSIKASNDGINFIDILSGTIGNYGLTTIPVEHTDYYKYWRFYPITWSSEWYDIINLVINATDKRLTTGTEQDYDYYKDVYVYKAFKQL